MLARPVLPPDAPECEKDRQLLEQARTIRELEIVVKGYEDNLGEPLRKVQEDVEREWAAKLEKEVKLKDEKAVWADELVRQLERERKVCFFFRFSRITGYFGMVTDGDGDFKRSSG